MSGLNVLRAAHYSRMPWKNGGGITEEIARDVSSDRHDFGWRISIAEIADSGDFSRFAGYQRVITVLHGDGMSLQVDGCQSPDLRPFEAFAFDGASQVFCTLLGGTLRDFNLIYAPQRFEARLQWFDDALPITLFTSASTLLLFSAGDNVQVQIVGYPVQTLGVHDALQLDREQGALVKMTLSGRCCLVELTER